MSDYILYARFSDRPDASTCDSCEKQLADMRAYCAREGHTVVGEYRDDAISGAEKSEIRRPGIWDAIATIRRGQTILARDISRYARDMGILIEIERRIKAKGGRIRTIQEGEKRPDDPMSTFLYRIFGAFSELQRCITREYTRAKMRSYQQNGRCMSCEAPFGWEKFTEDATMKLRRNEAEQVALQRLIELRTQGVSERKTAAILHAEGYRNRRNKRMGDVMVHRLWHRYLEDRQPRVQSWDKPPMSLRDAEEPIGNLV
jgi:DNA invertase Pin-like site-specific DNA recombinase